MRITYRDKNNHDYWTKRWTDIESDEPMVNDYKYPLKSSRKFSINYQEPLKGITLSGGF